MALHLSERFDGRKADASVIRAQVPVASIVADESNRLVTEDEDFAALCDSIRVQGLLAPVHVWR